MPRSQCQEEQEPQLLQFWHLEGPVLTVGPGCHAAHAPGHVACVPESGDCCTAPLCTPTASSCNVPVFNKGYSATSKAAEKLAQPGLGGNPNTWLKVAGRGWALWPAPWPLQSTWFLVILSQVSSQTPNMGGFQRTLLINVYLLDGPR